MTAIYCVTVSINSCWLLIGKRSPTVVIQMNGSNGLLKSRQAKVTEKNI